MAPKLTTHPPTTMCVGSADGTAALPSADGIVRACLDLIPLDHSEAQHERGTLTVDEMRRQRQAKNLTNAAMWHRDRIKDAQLTAELEVWIEVVPGWRE